MKGIGHLAQKRNARNPSTGTSRIRFDGLTMIASQPEGTPCEQRNR